MNARQLKSELSQALLEKSGLEQRRAYLGMSQIGRCPRQLYWAMVEGRSDTEMNEQRHWFCWTGYLHEAAMLELLGVDVSQQGVEIVADFDRRFRGHVDCVLDSSGIAEIKSVSWRKFQRIREWNRPDHLHMKQVQSYLHHGIPGAVWDRAFIIYLARDVPFPEWRGFPIWVFGVPYNEALARMLDVKAQRILAAVDAGTPPECECGRCRR